MDSLSGTSQMIDVVDQDRQATLPELDEGQSSETEPAKDYVYCATCSNILAKVGDRIAVNGSHDHVFTNPHGFTFHLGCFAQALGCAIAGERHAADSWFAGFMWRLATCNECNNHLGWYFDGRGEDYFYGLILNRIQYE